MISTRTRRWIRTLERVLLTLGVAVFCTGMLYTVYLDLFRPRGRNDALGYVVVDKLWTGNHFVTEHEKTLSWWFPMSGWGMACLGGLMRKRREWRAEEAKRRALAEEERH